MKYACTLLALLLILSCTGCSTSGPESTAPSGNSGVNDPSGSTQTTMPTFVEQTLVNNDQITVKITAIEDDSLWGYTLKAFLENKTDKELMFSISNASLNGFMCDPLWAATVQPGMKANESISFSASSMDRNGIQDVTEIEFNLRVYDNNDWNASDVLNQTYTLYPMGQDAVKEDIRQEEAGEIVLFDDETCTIIITGFEPDNTFGYAVNVYLENKTDKNLMFSVNDASVNGFMCDPFWAQTVAAGKRSNTQILWTSSNLEKNQITQIETITLPLRVYDADDLLAENLVEKSFTVNP